GGEEAPQRIGGLGLVTKALTFGTGGPLVLVAFLAVDLPPNHTDPQITEHSPVVNASLVTVCVALGYVAALLLLLWLENSRTRTLFRRVVDAPPYAAVLAEGVWGRAIGTVRDPTPVAVGDQPAAFAL